MSRPQAYAPEEGYKFQILCRQSGAWEHCDYAKDRTEKRYLIGEYALAYGGGWQFKSILLPLRYWPKFEPETTAQKLDRLFPVQCDICKAPSIRASSDWPICPVCKHNAVGPEASIIQKMKGTASY